MVAAAAPVMCATVVRRLGRRVRRDGVELLGQPWDALRAGQLSRFWLGPAAAAAVLVMAELARSGRGQVLLRRWAIMRGDQPWWLTVQKVPLSLFAPAYLLPFGFAVLQVFVVFGGAQVLIGVRRTVVVGLAAHVLGSLSPRLWVWIASPLGLPARFLHQPDAGPSVATVGVAVYLVIRLRIIWLATLLAAYHLAEWLIITGLAQREHLVGAATGAVIALGPLLVGRRGAAGHVRGDHGPGPVPPMVGSRPASVPAGRLDRASRVPRQRRAPRTTAGPEAVHGPPTLGKPPTLPAA